MSDYLSELRKAIKAVHGCDADHVATFPVKEVFQGETAWEGRVEVFRVSGHAKAKRCYAWGFKENGEWEITAVLEIPPVVSPQTAVKAAIVSHARRVAPPQSRKP